MMAPQSAPEFSKMIDIIDFSKLSNLTSDEITWELLRMDAKSSYVNEISYIMASRIISLTISRVISVCSVVTGGITSDTNGSLTVATGAIEDVLQEP